MVVRRNLPAPEGNGENSPANWARHVLEAAQAIDQIQDDVSHFEPLPPPTSRKCRVTTSHYDTGSLAARLPDIFWSHAESRAELDNLERSRMVVVALSMFGHTAYRNTAGRGPVPTLPSVGHQRHQRQKSFEAKRFEATRRFRQTPSIFRTLSSWKATRRPRRIPSHALRALC